MVTFYRECMPDIEPVTTTIYLEATAERVWRALTDATETAEFWGSSNVSSDWKVGSEWAHVTGEGAAQVEGTILESDPPRLLVNTWAAPGHEHPHGPSVVTFEIEQFESIVRLTVTDANLASEAERTESASGWSAVLSNLKTFVETGHPLPVAPWLMPARTAPPAA